jgi:hypothetical protein
MTSFCATFGSGRLQVTAGETVVWRETTKLRDLLALYDEMAKGGAMGEARAKARVEIALLLDLLSLPQWEARLTKAIDVNHQQDADPGGRKDYEAISQWLAGQDSVERLVEALQGDAAGVVESDYGAEPD